MLIFENLQVIVVILIPKITYSLLTDDWNLENYSSLYHSSPSVVELDHTDLIHNQEKGKAHSSSSWPYNQQIDPEIGDVVTPSDQRITFGEGLLEDLRTSEDFASFYYSSGNNQYPNTAMLDHCLPLNTLEGHKHLNLQGHKRISNFKAQQVIGNPPEDVPLSSPEFDPIVYPTMVSSYQNQRPHKSSTFTNPLNEFVDEFPLVAVERFEALYHELSQLLESKETESHPASTDLQHVENMIPEHQMRPTPLETRFSSLSSPKDIASCSSSNMYPKEDYLCHPKNRISISDSSEKHKFSQNLDVSEAQGLKHLEFGNHMGYLPEYHGLDHIFQGMEAKELELIHSNFRAASSSNVGDLVDKPTTQSISVSSGGNDVCHRMLQNSSNGRKRKKSMILNSKEKFFAKAQNPMDNQDNLVYGIPKEQKDHVITISKKMHKYCMDLVDWFCESQGIKEELIQEKYKVLDWLSKLALKMIQKTSEHIRLAFEQRIQDVIRRSLFEVTVKFIGILKLLNPIELSSKTQNDELLEDGWKFMNSILANWQNMQINPSIEMEDSRFRIFFDLTEPDLLFRYLLKSQSYPSLATSLFWHLWKDWYRSSEYKNKKLFQNEEKFWNELYIVLTKKSKLSKSSHQTQASQNLDDPSILGLLPHEKGNYPDTAHCQINNLHPQNNDNYFQLAGRNHPIDVSDIAHKIGSAEFDMFTLRTKTDRWFDWLYQEMKHKLLVSSSKDSVNVKDILGAVRRFYIHIIPAFFGALKVLSPEHLENSDIVQDGWEFFKKELEECVAFNTESYVRKKRHWKISDELYIPHLFHLSLDLNSRRNTVNSSMIWRLYLLWYKKSSLPHKTHAPKFQKFKQLFIKNYWKYFSPGGYGDCIHNFDA